MNENNKIMIHIIDDEPIIHDVLGQLLQSEGYQVEISASGEEALAKFPHQKFDLTLLDLLMPGMDGLEVLRQIKRVNPESVVIIITAYASVESALTAMKMGAYDYIQKPFKNDELLMTISRALEHRHLQLENIRLQDELKRKFSFENIIGKSQPMQNVFDLIKAAAPTRSTLLIQGESGTGKELVARAVHINSDRASHPFVVVNSGSLPSDLLESHLFGHVKGLLLEPCQTKRDCLKLLIWEPSSLMKFLRSALKLRSNYCGLCRTENLCASVVLKQLKLMSGLSLLPIPNWKN